MKHLSWLVTAVALAASSSASALGGLADVAIVDRDSGATLSTYYYRGEYWVAGNPGGRYAIEVRNRSGGRLLAVTAVDGINVLSGATAGFDQAGYVFDPGESYQITGWRKSNNEVAAFTFTDLPNSYAARTGRAANVGVIGVAVFRERVPRYIPPRITQAPVPGAAEARAQAGDSDQEAIIAGGLSAPTAGAATKSGEAARRDYLAADSAPAPRLGTGHGERESSVVQETEFQRQQPAPNEIIRIRYDSMNNLVAMGVVRRVHPLPNRPEAFPGSSRQFVPDPPAG